MEAYDRLAAELESAGIKKSSMFGMSALKLGKKPICGLWEDGVNFKLVPGSDIYERALALKGAHMFQPVMKNGRVMNMRNWVVVPFEHEGMYLELAAASVEMVQKELLADSTE